MSNFVVAILMSASFAHANIFSCEVGQTFVLPRGEPAVSTFYVCDKSQMPRQLSRGELISLYNTSKTKPEDLKTWAKILGTDPNPEKITAALRPRPGQEMVEIKSTTDLVAIYELNGFYQAHFFKKKVIPMPKKVSEAEEKSFFDAVAVGRVATCKGAGAMVQSRDSNNCLCAGLPLKNPIDFVCKDGKTIVPTAGSGTAQGVTTAR